MWSNRCWLWVSITGCSHFYLVGGIPTPLKNMSLSVGMMKFPIHGKSWNCCSKPPTSYPFFLRFRVDSSILSQYTPEMPMFSDHEICSVVKTKCDNHSPKFTGIFPQSQCKGLVKRSLLCAPVFVDIPIRNQKQRACVLVVIMLGKNWKTHVLSNPPVDELHSQQMPRIAGTQISWSIPRVLWIKTYHPRLETQKKVSYS